MLRTPAKIVATALLLSLSIFITKHSVIEYTALSQGAAVFLVDNIKPEDLKAKYKIASREGSRKKVRVFIMPGHEPNFGGTEYKNVMERDLNVRISEYLQDYLEADPRYQVVAGRGDRAWNPELEKYFIENRNEIKAWKSDQVDAIKALVDEGSFEIDGNSVPHQNISTDVALRLYGINKWVGENKFDIAIHVHLNDHAGRKRNKPGKFTGHTIYVPESQYSNALAAQEVAKAIGGRLSRIIAVSDAKGESAGVVEDQELVALGRFNTADVPSILIEYGYIYEPQFQDEKVLDAVLKEYAFQTYLGLKDFFVGTTTKSQYATLPYIWNKTLYEDREYSLDTFALQLALLHEGYYPPVSKDLNSCPVSGIFGGCTTAALEAFQKKSFTSDEDGSLGDKSRAVLNTMFGKGVR